MSSELELLARELEELNRIGAALSEERDVARLLELIVTKAREITSSEAASLYLVEPTGGHLRFVVAQNTSIDVPFRSTIIEMTDRSIAGYVALRGEPVRLDDAYAPPPGMPYAHNRTFDDATGYRTQSVLAVPMRTPKGVITGVLQLINATREGRVAPYADRQQELALSLASQAAVAVENGRLYEEIQKLFEGFVRASVVAIESRDPATSGHSFRVANLSVALAEAADRADSGPFANVRFSREEMRTIRFASLLHDFGKVGVRENVLVKAKKLYEHERELILSRFDFIRKSIEADHSSRKLEHLIRSSREEALARIGAVDEEYQHKLKEIDDFIQFILKSNEPTVLDQGGFERIADIAKRTFADARGQEQPYLRPDEARALQILRGSLTPEERLEIESHVSHTIAFLERIPWGRAFVDIPLIAGAHHEKLDGTGYPNKLAGEVIPVPSKMMAICDIFDALSASDRPYKKAVPTDKALDIIGYEVKSGKCDPELFRIFVEARVYDVTTALK